MPFYNTMINYKRLHFVPRTLQTNTRPPGDHVNGQSYQARPNPFLRSGPVAMVHAGGCWDLAMSLAHLSSIRPLSCMPHHIGWPHKVRITQQKTFLDGGSNTDDVQWWSAGHGLKVWLWRKMMWLPQNPVVTWGYAPFSDASIFSFCSFTSLVSASVILLLCAFASSSALLLFWFLASLLSLLCSFASWNWVITVFFGHVFTLFNRDGHEVPGRAKGHKVHQVKCACPRTEDAPKWLS